MAVSINNNKETAINTLQVEITGFEAGADKQQVIQSLAQLFKTTEQEILNRLAQPQFIVKRNIDSATAEEYKTALKKVGCIVVVSSLAPSESSPLSVEKPQPVTSQETTKPLNQEFKVSFGVSGTYVREAPNSFSFHGAGTVQFHGEKISIHGKRYRFFWFGRKETHEFDRSEIRNASVSGAYVRFELDKPDYKGKTYRIGFKASSKAEAANILALIPDTQSEAFALEKAEILAFKQKLDELNRKSVVVPIATGLNIIIFILMAFAGAGVFTANPEVAIKWGSNFGPLTRDGEWWRLFTSTFIHFGILHLALNMFALYQTGGMVERMLGSYRFIAMYVFAGLTGSLVSTIWNPTINSAGASGAIFGVFGALFILTMTPKYGVPKSVMKEHFNSTAIFIAFNLMNGFSHAGIDNGAHIGGLLGGMIMGYLLARPVNDEFDVKSSTNQIGIATICGVLIIALMGVLIMHPSENSKAELAFTQAIRNFGAEEQEAVNISRKLLQPSPTTSEQLISIANAMEKDVLPLWEHMYQTIQSPKLNAGSRHYELQRLLVLYLDDRRQACRFLIEGFREENMGKINKAGALAKHADSQIEEMKKLKPK